MTQKTFVFAKDQCCQESADNPAFQEVLLSGHLYQMILLVPRIDFGQFLQLTNF